jgi:hypothetical protein
MIATIEMYVATAACADALEKNLPARVAGKNPSEVDAIATRRFVSAVK